MTSKPKTTETTEEKWNESEKENEYLRAEIDYRKKLNAVVQARIKWEPIEKVTAVDELRLKYPLKQLLKIAKLSKSSYYYTRNSISRSPLINTRNDG